MALTGIQIFKLLPKTNCKECGVPTCLAFAMNLASGKAELDACPYVSDEAREQLSEASAPPIRPVAIGKGVRAATTGGMKKLSITQLFLRLRWGQTSPTQILRPNSKPGMPFSLKGSA